LLTEPDQPDNTTEVSQPESDGDAEGEQMPKAKKPKAAKKVKGKDGKLYPARRRSPQRLANIG
jgi:hypothetical protein